MAHGVCAISMMPSLGPSDVATQGGVPCGACHEKEQADWDMSAHAHAFDDPVFQAAWRSQGETEICLVCHASGEVSVVEEGGSPGVSCQMCHGPGIEMDVDVTAEDCSVCHSYVHFPTYSEWLDSEHSHHETDCMVCHELPSLTLKTEDPNELCFGCHADATGDWEEGKHGTIELECVDCHMMRAMTKAERMEHDVTGHTFFPGVPDPDCEGCHSDIVQGHMAWDVGIEGCITCHNEIYMTRLHLANGTIITADEASVLCGQCHNEVYYEWSHLMHGSAHENKECIDCHVPWEPYVCWNATLPGVPFTNQSNANDVLMSYFSTPPLPMYAFLATVGVFLSIVLFNRRLSNEKSD